MQILINYLYRNVTESIMLHYETESFKNERSVKQGDTKLLKLFVTLLENIFRGITDCNDI